MGQTVSCGSHQRDQLFAAVREGDILYVEKVAVEEPKLLHKPRFYERLTPLHVAASHGQAEVLKFLLATGAEPNVATHNGKVGPRAVWCKLQSPLMLACQNGREACLGPLIEAGAHILGFEFINARTCLHYAAKGGHTECVRQILAAAQSGHVADSWGFVRFVNVRDGNGTTPLHLAARAGHVGVLRLLLEDGALVSAATATTGPGHGSTPLQFAAYGGSLECVRELIAWGADRRHRNIAGFTAYGVAMRHGHTECASILDPSVAEPLVWPSPWKFMSELDPEAKFLLEQALAEANSKREMSLSPTHRPMSSTLSPQDADGVSDEADDSPGPQNTEANEVCSICFEQPCTIEVKDCGHQMCATCTLALCCYSKPNPAIPYSPPPACPFCRCNIGQLALARPRSKEKAEGRDSMIKNKSPRLGKGSSGKLSLLKFTGRLMSAKIGDTEWLRRSHSLGS